MCIIAFRISKRRLIPTLSNVRSVGRPDSRVGRSDGRVGRPDGRKGDGHGGREISDNRCGGAQGVGNDKKKTVEMQMHSTVEIGCGSLI